MLGSLRGWTNNNKGTNLFPCWPPVRADGEGREARRRLGGLVVVTAQCHGGWARAVRLGALCYGVRHVAYVQYILSQRITRREGSR